MEAMSRCTTILRKRKAAGKLVGPLRFDEADRFAAPKTAAYPVVE
jgi:hypothetical protein